MIFIELTNIANASKYEIRRYSKLVCRVCAKGWQCHLLTVEVGSRGFVGFSCSRALTKLGWRNSKAKLLGRIGDIAWCASYVIWLNRQNKSWTPLSVFGDKESILG